MFYILRFAAPFYMIIGLLIIVLLPNQMRAQNTVGDAFAQNELGTRFYYGTDVVVQDYNEAARLFRLGADQGNAAAQNNLGVMYRNGKGGLQDYDEAARLFRLAAEQGYDEAQNNLGLMYEYGAGVLQDYVLAHMWFNISASKGNDDGYVNREILQNEMSKTDISIAQEKARVCLESDYQDCE